MGNRGKIISFTGFDGVGKTTHSAKIMDWLYNRTGLKGVSMHEVKDTRVYQCLDDMKEYYEAFKNYDVINTRFFLFSEENLIKQKKVLYNTGAFNNIELVKEVARSSRNDAKLWFENVLNPLLDQGKIIILDRYYYDEIAFKSLINIEKDFMKDLYKDFRLSDFPFLLHLDVEEVIKRNEDREDANTLLYQNKDKMTQLYNQFKVLEKECNMIGICTNRSEELVHSEIISKLEHLL